jgi:hypothetical protein
VTSADQEEVSTMTSSVSRSELWPEPWAIQVTVEANRIGQRVTTIRANGAPDDQNLNVGEKAVEFHLQTAREACKRSRKWRRRGLSDRWRGASVELAYRSLHSAKISMVDVLPDPDVAALVPEVSARLATTLERNDPRRAGAESAMQSPDRKLVRAAVRQATEMSYDASDEKYVRLRNFRNIIFATAAGIFLFTGILVWAVASAPDAIPLCFEPNVTGTAAGSGGNAGAPASQATSVCPSGDLQQPTAGDVVIIAGLGALGGGFGALLSIRNLRGSSTPYGVPMALAVLKVPSGALTALIGMLLLAGGFVPGLSNLDSQRQILAYAVLFGYAQQLITRLADNQAQTILNRLPSKDPEAEQPAVVAPVLPVALMANGQHNGQVNGRRDNARHDVRAEPDATGGKGATSVDGSPSDPASAASSGAVIAAPSQSDD